MELALSIWIMLYSPPVKPEFHIVNAVPAITHEVNSIVTTSVNQTKEVYTSSPNPSPSVIYDNAPQGVITEPTGCPYGDAIPLDSCDAEKYQNQIH